MASTSASRGDAGTGRIATATTTLSSDIQSIIAEIRRGLSMIKSIAVDLEKENRSDMVKQLEDSVLELLVTSEDCAAYSKAVEAVGNEYQPKEELTDFKKLLEYEVAKLKKDIPSAPQSNPFFRQFKEAVWNVHHAGQPMPGEEQEDIVMTSTQSNLLNITCPLSGKPVTELENPVRSIDCKHIYEKEAVMHYIKSKKSTPRCPVAGCPKILVPQRVIFDPFLLIEIEEMRSKMKESMQATVVEDFTELDE
ncbi:E3 SUMO-protein ligase MMS21 [Aristolochia californica]|uniref:E3 SUMO-protein ligase MMS21 n=1 Tax=Aristolochia californica TaxID=171875 RepID=UPI0035E2CB40